MAGYSVTEMGATALRAVTPSDSVNFVDGVSRAIWVGGTGDVAILAEGDAAVITIAGVQAGTLLPIRTRRVNLTNTTATLLVAMY